MADSVSIPEENGSQELRQKLSQHEAELALLNSVQQGLASRLDIQSIYELVGDRLHAIFEGRSLGIGTYDHQNDLLHPFGLAKRIHDSIQFPVPPAKADVGPCRTEQVLPIMEIKHRIAVVGLLGI